MHRSLLLFPLLVTTLTLGAQTFDFPTTHRPLISKKTATWCSNCGTWGWTLFRDLIEDNAEQAELVALHNSGNLKTDAASDLAANFGGVGQPVFSFDEIDVGATSSNSAAKRVELQQEVMEAAATSAPLGTGIQLERNGDVLTIRTQTRFFEAEDGRFLEAVYLVEKSRTAQQSGQGADAEHKHLLRLSLDDNTFGQEIANGPVPAGFETSIIERTLDLADYDPANLRIVAVVWEQFMNSYLVANTNGVEVSAATTGTYDVPLRVATLEARPSVTTGQTALSLIVSAPTSGRLELVSAEGRVTPLLATQRFSPGRLWIPLDLGAYATGTYYVRLVGLDGTATTTVVRR